MSIELIGPAKIPSIGFGTFELPDEETAKLVSAALAEGYRHIDTAQVYKNETGVGKGIAQSDVPRDQIFLTTKIFPDHFAPDAFKTKLDESLSRLGTDYVDLLLLHWPSKDVPIADTMGAMNDLVAAGKVRHGGVSNFTIAMIDEAEAALDTPLAANQVEVHPFIPQEKLLKHLESKNIPFEAYSPLARGNVMKDETLKAIAADHNATPAQISLAWILSKPNAVVLPKTATPERLAGNLAAAEIKLSDEEIAKIDALVRPDGRIISPGFAPDWD
ncbi:aldo/keto reductase [Paracoccaceae bacterium GXU_MW_L88]